MGKYLTRFFVWFGVEAQAWFQVLKGNIEATLEHVFGNGNGAKMADAAIAAALMAEIWKNNEELRNRINKVPEYIEGGASNVICSTLEELTGHRPEGVTQLKMQQWGGRLVVSELNDTLGVSVAAMDSAADINNLIAQLKQRVVNELMAGGETYDYKILTPHLAKSFQKQIAFIANRAQGLKMFGFATKLPLDRKKMLLKLRQKRFRENHSIWWECYGWDAEIDQILNDLAAQEAALGVGLSGAGG